MAATVTRKPESTVSVRISRALADAIAKSCEGERIEPSKKFGDEIMGWAVSLLKTSIKKAAKPDGISLEPLSASTDRSARMRLDRAAVAKLGVVAAITGRTVSDMVEEKMWEVLAVHAG